MAARIGEDRSDAGPYGGFHAVEGIAVWLGRRGRVLGVVAVAGVGLCLLLVGHRVVPGAAGSLLDSVLPWASVPILLLLVVAVVARRIGVIAVAAVPAAVWVMVFFPDLTDHSRPGAHDLRVASLDAGHASAADVLPPLLGQRPDVIVLTDIDTGGMTGTYPYHEEAGTVAVLSRFPLTQVDRFDPRIGLAVTVTAPDGLVRIYAAHLRGRDDRTLKNLAAAAHADPSPRLVLAGDLSTATTDRRFALLAPLRDTQQQAGDGFGFTWPAGLPLVRPDHILERGMTTRRSWALRVAGSDHRAVLADLD